MAKSKPESKKDLEIKSLNFNTEYNVDTLFDDERFIKLRLKVMHDGKNPKFSNFSLDSIEQAKPTLANIPILANTIVDDKGADFGAHDIAIGEGVDGELRLIYKEIPIGMVPETNNYSVELDEESGKNYVYCDGYIWREYSNLAEDVIEKREETGLSMEILPSEYSALEDDENYTDITKYKYTGITLLGEKYGTGMENAKAEKVEFNIDENKESFIKMAEELKFALENNKPDEVPTVDSEPIIDSSNQDVTPPTETKFMLDSEKREKIFEALPRQESTDDIRYYYWLMDTDEKYAYVSEEINTKDSSISNYWKYSYTIDENDEVTVDGESREEIEKAWITKAEAEKLEADREAITMSLQSKIDDLSKDLESYKSNLDEKDGMIKELTEYKSNIESEIKKADVEELIEEFTDTLKDVEEFVELQSKALDMEIADLEKELYALVGKVKHQKKTKKEKKSNFSKVVSPVEVKKELEVDVDVDVVAKATKHYGDAAKYFKKK